MGEGRAGGGVTGQTRERALSHAGMERNGLGCGETRARETGGWGPVAGAVGRARPFWSAGESTQRGGESWARMVRPAGLLVGLSRERGKRGAGWAGLTGLESGFGSSFFFLSSFSNKLKPNEFKSEFEFTQALKQLKKCSSMMQQRN